MTKPTPDLRDPPFRTGEIVSDEHFTDRATEVETVRRAMLSSGRLLLVGERRQGKSSILKQAGLYARARGAVVIPVDLWTAMRLEEVLRRIVAAVPWDWAWRERLQTFWTRLGLGLGVRADHAGNPAFTLTASAGELEGDRARELFLQLIGRLDIVAGEAGHAVVLVLDEFQRIEEMETGAAALLRSAIQESHHLAFVCAGSTVSLVDRLVGPDGALHGIFDLLAVGPIDADLLAVWIEDRLDARSVRCGPGTGAAVVAWAGPRTEDVLRLAREVYERGLGPGRVTPDDVPAAVRRIVLDHRATYERVWVDLADSQRNVLRAIASGETRLTARATMRRFGLPTPAGVLKAIERLRARHLLTGVGESIADPFLRAWVLMDAMPDGVDRSTLDR
jgi:hypothetical protein